MLDNIQAFLNDIVDYVLDWFFYFFDVISGIINQILDGIVAFFNVLQAVLNWMLDLFSSMWFGVVDLLVRMWGLWAGIVNYFVNFFVYGLSWLVDFIGALYEDIVNYDGSFFTYILGYWRDIFVLGFGKLYEWFSAFLSFFGISPIAALAFLLLIFGFQARLAILQSGVLRDTAGAVGGGLFGGLFSLLGGIRFNPLSAILVLFLFYVVIGLIFDFAVLGIFALAGIDDTGQGLSGAARSVYDGIVPITLDGRDVLITEFVNFVIGSASVFLHVFAVREVIQLLLVAWVGRFFIDKFVPQLNLQLRIT